MATLLFIMLVSGAFLFEKGFSKKVLSREFNFKKCVGSPNGTLLKAALVL